MKPPLLILCALICGCGFKAAPPQKTTKYLIVYQFMSATESGVGNWDFNVKRMNAQTIADIKEIIASKTPDITGGTNGIVVLNVVRLEP